MTANSQRCSTVVSKLSQNSDLTKDRRNEVLLLKAGEQRSQVLVLNGVRACVRVCVYACMCGSSRGSRGSAGAAIWAHRAHLPGPSAKTAFKESRPLGQSRVLPASRSPGACPAASPSPSEDPGHRPLEGPLPPCPESQQRPTAPRGTRLEVSAV